MPRDMDSSKKVPKKKVSTSTGKSISKEKSATTSKTKDTSPEKPSEKANVSIEKETGNESLLIYNHSKFNEHPILPEMDLIKILVRSPKEIYVFWKLDPKTFPGSLETPERGPVQFSLKVRYQTSSGNWEEVWYDLLPFTESYYCKFPYPIFEIEASLYANNAGVSTQILHTKDGDLPPSSESLSFDRQWIHPDWVNSGLLTVDTWGNHLLDEQSGFGSNQTNIQNTIPRDLPSSHTKANPK